MPLPAYGVIRHVAVVGGLGFLVASLVLAPVTVVNPQVDPTDAPVTYVVWCGGLFFVALRLGQRKPERARSSAAALMLGFMLAKMVFFTVDVAYQLAPHNLLPLEILFALFVAAVPSFGGAFLGRSLAPGRGMGA